MKERLVFKKSLAIALRKKGYSIIRVEVNFKNPQFDVYVFLDDGTLGPAIAELNLKK